MSIVAGSGIGFVSKKFFAIGPSIINIIPTTISWPKLQIKLRLDNTFARFIINPVPLADSLGSNLLLAKPITGTIEIFCYIPDEIISSGPLTAMLPNVPLHIRPREI